MNWAWLSFQGQAVDELGMICASLAFLYVVLEVGHLDAWRWENVGKKRLGKATEMWDTCTVLACEKNMFYFYVFNHKDVTDLEILSCCICFLQ